MPQNFPVPITLPEEDTLIEFPWARLKKLDETIRGLGQMNTPDRDIVRKKLKETMKALIVSIEDAKWVNCDAYDAKKEKEEDIQCDMIELKKFELPLAKEEYRKAKKNRHGTAMHNVWVYQELPKKMDAYKDFVKPCQKVVDSYGPLPPYDEVEVGDLE